MPEDIKISKGKLFIVSTPIGNKDDFTIRAMNSIKRCDFVICEELKIGAKTLKQLNLSKDLVPLNEHNEVEATDEILTRIINGDKACLISDDGTPLIADPGNFFMKEALRRDIDIEIVPGVTSIITALVRSGLPTDQFLFAGFVSRKTEEKFQDVRDLSREKRTVVLLETPYRLASTLEVLTKIMPNRRAYIGMNLTHPYETHHYGTFEELFNKLKDLEIKAEFVICFEGSDFGSFHKKDDFSEEKGFNRSDFEKSPRMDESGSYRNDRSGSSYNRDRSSGGRDNRDWDRGNDNIIRDGGYKKKLFGSRAGGYKKNEFGDRDGGYKKKEYGSRDGGFKKKEFGSRDGGFAKKEFDKPRNDNFQDGDFDNTGFFTKEYNKSPERGSGKIFGDKPSYSKGGKSGRKFGSKSGVSKFGGKKFVKRGGGTKGKK